MDQLLGKLNLNESRETYQPPMLMDMPEVVMKLILEETDFQSVQTLRKVCHSLRSFIDDIHPEAHLDVINVIMDFETISVFFKRIHVEYRRHEENSCSISYENKLKIFEDTNYIDRFSMDFELILRSQNSILNLFQVSLKGVDWEEVDEIFLKIECVLKSKKLPLKTQEVQFSIEKQENVLSVLPYLDPKHLKNLVINDSEICNRDLRELEIDEIMELEQWKNLNQIFIPTFKIGGTLKNFQQCSKMEAKLEDVSMEELMELKEVFLSKSSPKRFCFDYENFHDSDKLNESFGPSFDGAEVDLFFKQWFFRAPDSSHVLEISFYPELKTIDFSRVDFAQVPHGAVVQDCFYE